jgi:hypothetical protein
MPPGGRREVATAWGALVRRLDAGSRAAPRRRARRGTPARAGGGFRPESVNYVGADAIENARAAFRSEGFDLSFDGILLPVAFDGLTGRDATEALRSYARRAIRGSDDNPLVVGTSKDLLEATAAHVLTEWYGSYPHDANFPTLLGQAFVALNLATPAQSRPSSRWVTRCPRETWDVVVSTILELTSND